MKLELLVANEEALKTLAGMKISNAQLSWDLAESLDVVEKAMVKFQEKRTSYIREFGQPDPENVDKFFISDPKAFTEEMKQLLEIEIDVVFPTVSLDLLNGAEISPTEIRGLKALEILVKSEVETVK